MATRHHKKRGRSKRSRKQDSKPAAGGGTAVHAGINFQDRVATWVAVRILCEAAGEPIFGLPAIPDFLRCETSEPVDDLLVGSNADAFAYAQAKHSLNLSPSRDSILAGAISQFARQTLAHDEAPKVRPWDRKLDVTRDALVLVTSSESPATVRDDLKIVLAKVRMLLPSQPVADAPGNAGERRALQIVEAHFRRSFLSAAGRAATDAEVRTGLRLMRVEILDVDPQGSGEREAKDLLRSVVLRDPAQADSAWSTLVQACAHLAESHSGADRAELQQILLRAGFERKVAHSYQADVERLRRISEKNEETLSDLRRIRIGQAVVKIDRAVTQEIKRLAQARSLLVVGEPGAGKSGALGDFVELLKVEGRDHLVMAVNRVEAASEGQLRDELGLEHELDEILENWPGQEPAFLVIDALDAARGGEAAQTIRRLIAQVSSRGTRWRVIASIRKFDLRYSEELRGLFLAGGTNDAGPEFRDDEFFTVSHANVRKLTETELGEVQAQSVELAGLLGRAAAELRDLLRVPFNLRLLAELLGAGIELDQLTPIRTQLELLDKYWRYRVLGSDREGDLPGQEGDRWGGEDRLAAARGDQRSRHSSRIS